MAPAVLYELKRGAIVFVACMLFGLILGRPFFALLVAIAALLVIQLRATWRLHRWMASGASQPPGEKGLLGEIEARLVRVQRQARKRKRRLSKVAARFQQAAEANPDGAMIIDGNGCIEWLNKAAARMLGLRQGQDHGQMLINLVRNPGFSAWLDAGEPDETFELDSPLESAPRLLLRAVPYGGSKRMLMVRDITRLHQLEQMRRDFVANVSHELRSPLTVVVGYLEGMGEDKQLPESLRRPVTQMIEQSARMTRIVEDLLRLSRIESDPQAAAQTPINVADLVESIMRDAQRISGIEHVLESDVEPDLLLLGDYNELYSAFSNLVFNAVQYTPHGGTITLSWTAGADAGYESENEPDGECAAETSAGARFAVHDSGEGIEAHHVPRLTERFYRVDKARSRELGGTGLGLAIVKHVLMRHDARLWIASEVGKGSVFTCEFPSTRVRCRPPVADGRERNIDQRQNQGRQQDAQQDLPAIGNDRP